MPVPHQLGLFKSILYIVVSFSSSSLKRLRINESCHQKKYENNLHIVNANILIQNRHKRCINVITMFNMNKCLNNQRKIQLEHSNEQKFLLVSGLVTSNGEPWRGGRKTQPGHLG